MFKNQKSNINQNINSTEFFELHNQDNCGLFRASAEAFTQQVSQLKNKYKKIHKIKPTCENLLSNNTNEVQCKKRCSKKRRANTAHS